MWKKTLLLVLALAWCCGSGCAKKTQDNRAVQERAFRDRQRNLAIKTYQDLAKRFPDSQYAPMAKERLDALQAQPKK